MLCNTNVFYICISNIMATSNRLRNKDRQTPQSNMDSTSISIQNQHKNDRVRPKIFSTQNIRPPETQLEKYASLKQRNPNGIQFSLENFPFNSQLNALCSIPLSFTFSPFLSLYNHEITAMSKSIDDIPRCGGCRAYMNCFNQINSKLFQCFFCGSDNYLGQYNREHPQDDQRNFSIYQAVGSKNCYLNTPGQECIIFLIDLSSQSYLSNVLHYASAAIQQSFSKQQLQQTTAYIFGYDSFVYIFDLSGEQIKCSKLDKTLSHLDCSIIGSPVKDCKDKVEDLMDYMESYSQKNEEGGSSFFSCFELIYNGTKHLGGKYFIIQVSQLIRGQAFMNQTHSKSKDDNAKNSLKPKSLYQSRNKLFIQKFGNDMLNNSNSISLFLFSKGFKNIRVFTDIFKIANCQIKHYSKSSNSDLEKFYYEFSYLLTATYFKDVKIQFLINKGWSFNSIYSNSHRIKEHIIFFSNHTEPSRQFVVGVNPSKFTKESPFYCALQLVINYRFQQQHFATIVNIVQTVTGSIEKIYKQINIHVSVTTIGRTFLSNLRIDSLEVSTKKLINLAAKIYKGSMEKYKDESKIPETIFSIILSTLGMLKSWHSQPDIILNSQLFDKTCAERNFLQFSNSLETSAYFLPYIFDISSIENESICEDGQDFTYPNTVEARFINIKNGIFLMDNGVSLYLFISRECDENLMLSIIGKQKIGKNEHLTQQDLRRQGGRGWAKLQRLIDVLRQQKSYGWVPLHVIKCGENSGTEKNFYLNFYSQKYDQFKRYKYTLEEYLEILKETNIMAQ